MRAADRRALVGGAAAALRRAGPRVALWRAASVGLLPLVAFSAAAIGAGLGRALVTTYLPVLLDRIQAAPGLIGTVLLVNAAAGFLVPLGVGLWSDRLRARGRERSVPLILGGALVTGGGLVAIGLGNASTYLTLTAFAALAYVGLNTVTTSHRTLIPESFAPETRARATGAQEVAIIVGSLLGVLLGGALIDVDPLVLFAIGAALVPLLAVPTVLRMHGRETFVAPERARERRSRAYYLQALRTRGVAAMLGAQLLWVLGYAALPAFFILYAENVLNMEPARAAVWLVAFGAVTGATMLAAGQATKVSGHRALLALGVAAMGAGFLIVAGNTELWIIGVGLAGAAIGFGIVSTIGFPLYSELIPVGQTGGYTALYFSTRAIASAVALPAAGWTIAATDSYRSLFVVGGIATIAALLPLARVPDVGGESHWSFGRREVSALTGPVAVSLGAVLLSIGAAYALSAGPLERLDIALFRAINGLGPWPDIAHQMVNPHMRNYMILTGVAIGLALAQRRRVLPVAALIIGSWILSYALAAIVALATDRPRPEEIVDDGIFEGEWSAFASFPSGHAAVTAALAVSIAALFPRLRIPMLIYLVIVANSRIAFGAHFPFDVVGGVIIGYVAFLAVGWALVGIGMLDERPTLRRRARGAIGQDTPPEL